jgi:hypothetical protein
LKRWAILISASIMAQTPVPFQITWAAKRDPLVKIRQPIGRCISSKFQAPTSRETPSAKLQTARERAGWIGYWNFSGAWMLETGAFA